MMSNVRSGLRRILLLGEGRRPFRRASCEIRDQLISRMTPEQVAQAQERARTWNQ